MKIKCYDKYHKQHLIIDLNNDGADDEIDCNGLASMYGVYNSSIYFRIDSEYYKNHPDEYAEDPDPKRWSDLTDFELIK